MSRERVIYENDKSFGRIETNWLGVGKLIFKGKEFKLGLGGWLVSCDGTKLFKARSQRISSTTSSRYLFEDVEANPFFVFKDKCLTHSPEHYDHDDNATATCVFDFGRRSFTIGLLEDTPLHFALFFGLYLFQTGVVG